VHRCTPEFCGIWARTCQEGAPAEVIGSRRNLKVVEHLGGETVQRRTQQKTESLRDSVELCQEGIEQVHIVHRENSTVSSKGNRITEDSIELCQEGIEQVPVCTKRTPLSSGIEKCPRRRTFTGLLNTLQAQQGVLEQEVAKRAFPSLQGEMKSRRHQSHPSAEDACHEILVFQGFGHRRVEWRSLSTSQLAKSRSDQGCPSVEDTWQ
jgi:hypothetical protein